jgi:hypothetical protein
MPSDAFHAPAIIPATAAESVLPKEASPADRKKLTEVFALLLETPTGKNHVQRVVSYRLLVRFDTREGGAVFNPVHRTITLNRTKTSSRTATELVHEAVHARSHHEGRGPNVMAQSRNAFVAGMIAEETATYLEEAVVGRELLHCARIRGRESWKELCTAHELQMYFQLVHGVPYKTRPSEAVLESDLALGPNQLRATFDWLRPYFRNYVSAYNRVEGIRWDIVHGLRPPMDPTFFSELLSTAFGSQDRALTYPTRELLSAARR